MEELAWQRLQLQEAKGHDSCLCRCGRTPAVVRRGARRVDMDRSGTCSAEVWASCMCSDSQIRNAAGHIVSSGSPIMNEKVTADNADMQNDGQQALQNIQQGHVAVTSQCHSSDLYGTVGDKVSWPQEN